MIHGIVRESHGFALLQDDDGRRTVVRLDRGRFSVGNAMPGDSPGNGLSLTANATDSGVDYVASWYSRSYANRVFRSLVAEAAS